MYLKLNRIQFPVHNLGPGKRIGIWVQGCSIQCADCINPSIWGPDNGKKVDIESLVSQICQIQHDYQGITISGGEPFDQYKALVYFCACIKKMTDLDIFVFSGYTLEILNSKFPDKLFGKYMDYLLDGPYIKEKHENQNYRGSSNQNLYQIKNNIPALCEPFWKSKKWSFELNEKNKLFMTGIPKENELSLIKQKMKSVGINMEYR